MVKWEMYIYPWIDESLIMDQERFFFFFFFLKLIKSIYILFTFLNRYLINLNYLFKEYAKNNY